MAAAAAAAGLGVPVVVGARFALEPGRGRAAVPVRPALLGAVAGVLGVLAAFTFSAGVSDAAANPARFGQTWQLDTFLGLSGQDFGPVGQVLRTVAADPDVTGVDDARIGGAQSGQVSVESFTYAPVAGKQVPVVLTDGRMPSAPDEIVLAPTTASDMHAATGSVVRLAGAAAPRATDRDRHRLRAGRPAQRLRRAARGSPPPGTTGSSAARTTPSSSTSPRSPCGPAPMPRRWRTG